MNMDDNLLLVPLRNGDDRAWKQLFNTHYPVMCHLAFQYVKDDITAAALVDDVMADLWEKRGAIRIKQSLRSYLLSSVRNRCINYLRSFHIKNLKPLEAERFLEREVVDGTYPLGKMLDDEMIEAVRQAVDSLPDECRRILLKNKEDGLKYEQIANELGISVNTVKYHMKNAFALLRDKLGDYVGIFSLPVLLSILSK